MKESNDIQVLKELMNSYGMNSTPFLFAINFDLTDGFIIKEPLNKNDIYFAINGVGNKCKLSKHKEGNNRFIESFPESENSYTKKFNIVQNGLKMEIHFY